MTSKWQLSNFAPLSSAEVQYHMVRSKANVRIRTHHKSDSRSKPYRSNCMPDNWSIGDDGYRLWSRMYAIYDRKHRLWSALAPITNTSRHLQCYWLCNTPQNITPGLDVNFMVLAARTVWCSVRGGAESAPLNCRASMTPARSEQVTLRSLCRRL